MVDGNASGTVTVLATRSPMSDGPLGDPSPVTVLAVADETVAPALPLPNANPNPAGLNPPNV